MNAGPLAWLGGVEGGGQSVVVDCLSDALARVGHDVTVYTRRDDRALPRRLTTAAGVVVEHLDDAPAGGQAAIVDAFGAYLAAQWEIARPDIVHAHGWMSGASASAASRRLGLPLVATFHGLGRTKFQPRPPTGEIAVRIDTETALARAAERIIATSSAEVFELLGLGANPGAIKLIPCGVDLDVFAPAGHTAPPPGDAFRIATLSRLVPDAGVGDVIEALTHVDGVELVVGGGSGSAADILDDPDARALHALALARRVASRITFHGRVKRDEVAAFLRCVHAVVCVPWHDSSGTVALEAMACGVPVIVSSVGALVDAVADGMTGVHVPARSPRQLAYAIEALAHDHARRMRFGRYGVERASARYGWPRIAIETLEVYTSVLAREARAGGTRA